MGMYFFLQADSDDHTRIYVVAAPIPDEFPTLEHVIQCINTVDQNGSGFGLDSSYRTKTVTVCES